MAVYIDANALQAQLERKKVGIANQRYTEGWNDCMMRVKSMVSKAPAADVAPVVRCKDCEYSYDLIGRRRCSHGICCGRAVPPDFYCAEGKKKGE